MLELLLSPIDPSRLHLVDDLTAWHGRLMTAAWAFALPLGVVIARFFKILPGQDWPRALDSQVWWRAHLTLQYAGGVAMLAGFALALMRAESAAGPGAGSGAGAVAWLHGTLGFIIIGGATLQYLGGWLRGSKGGPTAPAPDGGLSGDHYDMTLRRRVFERLHKTLGYALVLAAMAAVLSGLWIANAPVWMWLALGLWWAALAAAFVVLQRRGMAVDTYQAIWGPDPAHPGNAMAPIGWGVRRPKIGRRGADPARAQTAPRP